MDKKTLENCWEIMKCNLKGPDDNTEDQDICPALLQNMGHSCWVVDDVLCEDRFLPRPKNKMRAGCLMCKVFRRYNRLTGTDRDLVKIRFPFENERYEDILLRERLRLKTRA